MSCPDCFTGSEHAGTPRGSEATLNGLPTYVSRPPQGSEPKGVVVYVPDLFGWGFVNNRLLCDAYAEKGGFLVYLPDLMGGEFFFSFLCVGLGVMFYFIRLFWGVPDGASIYLFLYICDGMLFFWCLPG